jgi:hypothetical protein
LLPNFERSGSSLDVRARKTTAAALLRERGSLV